MSGIPQRIDNDFTRMTGVRYPIVGAPMFLVSTPELVSAVSNAGALGSIPALNFRSQEEFEKGLDRIRSQTKEPFGINLTFKLQTNWRENFRYCLQKGVRVYLTSLGNPKEVCQAAHSEGAKVFCDVTNLHHALRAQEAGVDGVIAVSHGAGGHAGSIDTMALIPLLRERLAIPVLAAGSIMDGRGMAAAMSLGAIAAYMGTRFIATDESGAVEEYKRLCVESGLEDTEISAEVSGLPCRYFRKSLEKFRDPNGNFKPWRDIWSVGQAIDQVHRIEPAADIVRRTVAEYAETVRALGGTLPA